MSGAGRLLLVATLLAAAVLGVCGSAVASVVRLHGTIAAAPVWSGSRALVLMSTRLGYSLRTIDPAGTGATLAGVPGVYGAVELAASPSVVAIERADVGCAGEGRGCKYMDLEVEAKDIVASPLGASLACAASLAPRSCAREDACQEMTAVLVAAGRLAYQACPGGSEEGSTVVLDESVAPTTVQPLPQIALPQGMAGSWLVGLAPGWRPSFQGLRELPANPILVERNLLTGAEPLRISLPPERRAPTLRERGGYPDLAAVQEDGEVAYVAQTEGHPTLWRASPANPTPQRVGSVPVNLERRADSLPGRQFALAAGRVAFRLGSAVVVETLGGSPLGSVRDGPLEGFDFDGSHVLAAVTPCTESFLETWAPGEAAPIRPTGRCPAPTISRRVSFGRRGIRVTVACPARPPLGCPGTRVDVTFASNGSGGAVSDAESETVALLPGNHHTFSILVDRSSRRWLARHRGERVTITLLSGEGEPRRIIHVRAP
jgi:hypothetical protein